MAGKISKDKKKYIIAGISGILVIILILTAYSINSAKNDKKPTTDVSVEDSDKKVKSQSSASSDGGRVASTVEIEFEDSAVLVGTRFKVTAIVTPSDTDKALLWSSSDDSVFSVDENGIVTEIDRGLEMSGSESQTGELESEQAVKKQIVNISLTGEYENIIKFIKAIEYYSRIADVSNISLSPGEGTLLNASLTANFYNLNYKENESYDFNNGTYGKENSFN